MRLKELLLNLFAIGLIVILPHTELIPLFGYSIPILIVVWLLLKHFNEDFSSIGFSLKQFHPKAILIGSLSAILILSFMQLIFFPLLENLVVFEEKEVGLYAFLKENKWQFYFTLLMGWIIGGVYEEIVFHGFLFTRLEKMVPGRFSTKIAFIITASIFGAYHYQLGAVGLINALIVGLVYLGLFLYFKRNLWYAIFCHGCYNSIVITLIYLGYI